MRDDVIPFLELDATLDEWLASIDTRRCRLLHHFNVVRAECRRELGWAPAPVQALADVLGVHRRATGAALQRMVELGWLHRDPPYPSRPGSRPAMFIPNFWYPDWIVELRQPRELVLRSMGFRRGPEGTVVARSDGARLMGFDARPMTARQKRGEEPLSRAPISARLSEASRAPLGRASTGRGGAVWGARLSDRAQASHLSSVDPEGSISLGSEEQTSINRVKLAVIEAAAANPDGRPKDCYGKPLETIVALIRSGHPVDKLERVLRHQPGGLQVPKLVAWLVDQATIGFLALPSTAALEDRARDHELKARTFAAEGMDDLAQQHEDDARRLRQEIAAACETGPVEVAG